MAASNSVDDVSGWLDERLAAASPDLLRVMVKQFAETLMSTEADTVCGAVPVSGLGHPGGQRRAGHPETADGQLLPGQ
jgi:hypothetical protein